MEGIEFRTDLDDTRRGQSLVVWAISEGGRAARAADAYLAGLGEEPGDDPVGALLGTV